MAFSKVKVAILASTVVGFAAGGLVMGGVNVFASSTSNSTAAASGQGTASSAAGPSKHNQHKGYRETQLMEFVLHKNADKIATELKLSKQQLNSDLSSGKSLDDLAAAAQLSNTQLQTDLQNLIQSELQARVTAGHMTAAAETKVLQRLNQQLPKFMANKHLMHPPRKFTAGMHVLNYVATQLKLTPAELMSKLKAGESINQVAQAQGVTPATLQTKITNKLDAQMNSRVAKFMAKTNWGERNAPSGGTSTIPPTSPSASSTSAS